MPEGDTLFRTAAGLRPYLLGRAVTAAAARQPGPQADRLVGATVTGVDAQGKNLLIRFDNGLEVRTHLGMQGSWHRYRPGERWRRAPSRSRLVIEVPGSIAVCFDAPTVELFEQRAEPLHPALSRLGPDLLVDPLDMDEIMRRLRHPSRLGITVGEALLDQRALAGIGNEVRNQVLWQARISPFVALAAVDDAAIRELVAGAREILREGARTGIRPSDIHGRFGRPCPRCGARIRSLVYGGELPRIAYWCPRCQPDPLEASPRGEP